MRTKNEGVSHHKNRKEEGRLAPVFTEITVITPQPAPPNPQGGRHHDCPGDATTKAKRSLADTRHRPYEASKKLEVAPACHDENSG